MATANVITGAPPGMIPPEINEAPVPLRTASALAPAASAVTAVGTCRRVPSSIQAALRLPMSSNVRLLEQSKALCGVSIVTWQGISERA